MGKSHQYPIDTAIGSWSQGCALSDPKSKARYRSYSNTYRLDALGSQMLSVHEQSVEKNVDSTGTTIRRAESNRPIISGVLSADTL